MTNVIVDAADVYFVHYATAYYSLGSDSALYTQATDASATDHSTV